MRSLLAIVLLAVFSCVADNVVDSAAGQKRINAAMTAKYKQCNQQVGMIILMPFDEQESDVKECEAEILAAACPFNRIPAGCFLLLFKKSKGDLDG